MHERKIYFQNFAQDKKKLLNISILSISSPMHTKGKMIQRGNNYNKTPAKGFTLPSENKMGKRWSFVKKINE